MTTLKEILGQRVRAERRRLKKRDGRQMTISDLAGEIGSSAEVVGRIERGVVWPEYATLERLAGALGIKPLDLFSHLPATRESKGRLKDMVELIELAKRLNSADLKIAIGQMRVIAEARKSKNQR